MQRKIKEWRIRNADNKHMKQRRSEPREQRLQRLQGLKRIQNTGGREERWLYQLSVELSEMPLEIGGDGVELAEEEALAGRYVGGEDRTPVRQQREHERERLRGEREKRERNIR